ncbi:MAG: hypothetical protein KDD63_20750 [Bacteroidetes bacterium]|nr:hypothetical protein [Bacteroidota bacterium]MCB0843815.1 hypothetical protein [Bacteroidota bacterium]MCB0854669.1 hypothetical protein [Bacteroidota bacterium]
MKRLMILMVMGFLCLHLSAQDRTEKFYKKGEFMISVSPSYGKAGLFDSNGSSVVEDAFSNTLRVGYFVKDRWQVGVKSHLQLYTSDDQLKVNVPNMALYTRYYLGKGAWRAFFEAEGGVSQGWRSTPSANYEKIAIPYFQGSYGVAFRPGKGRMSLELSSALFNVSTLGTNLGLPRPQLGINFHF